MRQTLDWQPYYDLLYQDMNYRERLAAYAASGHERMQTDRFSEFCEEHLADLEQVTCDFLGSDRAKTVIREKVQTLFPEHEVESFTKHFWDRIQEWRSDVRSDETASTAQ